MIALLDNTILSNFAVVGRPDLVHQLTEEQAAALANEIDRAMWDKVRQSVCWGRPA